YRFVERETSSPWTAVLAIGLLFLMPRMVADLFTNIKDFPEMVFFSLALLVFHHAYERRSAGAIIASGAIWGLALGTKANALFLPPIVALFVLWRWLGNKSERQGRVLLAIAIAFVAGLAVLVISWPYLWAAPFSRMLENLQYVAVRGRGGTAAQNLAPWLSMVFYTTPLAVLLLFAIGLPSTIVRAWRGRSADQFLLVWLVVIVGRLSVPGAINFDGVRHFLELFPPIAAIAAIGGMESIRRVSAHPAFRATIASVVLLTTAFATWASHPFEIAYFNAFIGGLRGAQARGVPQATDYWGSSYRHGIGWMNENAPDGSALVVTIGSHMVRLGAQVWLKPGVTVLSGERATVEQAKTLARERPVYVMFITRNEWRTPIDRDAERRLRPVRVWSLDGAPILKLYRYTP
ncbi:MAG TPA: glycosyltransferase family 39 protein, partial [Thermoanaerobaculia bacterium]|nr:glycosyltransferase family 39 protein [Thermoanaerobaculia bacterium]